MKIIAKVVPTITKISIDQEWLDLTDKELRDTEFLKEYIQIHYTPN